MYIIFFILAVPDVTETAITEDSEFLVLACDGIWDVLTNQEVVDFVRTRIADRMDPEKVLLASLDLYDICTSDYTPVH